MTTASQRFADLHARARAQAEPFVLPNAWDVASGLLLADADFPAVGTTSLGVTAAAGLLDGAGAGRSQTIALAAALVPRLSVPLTVDVEGGYSDEPGEVADLATELFALGVAGINLEDGRSNGTLRPAADHAAVVRAVADAVPHLFLNARTDTYWLRTPTGTDQLREMLDRLAAYRDAGASGIFVPGLTDLRALESVAIGIELPLNALWAPGVPLASLAAAGVSRVSTGSALYRHALGAALAAARAAATSTPPTTEPLDYTALQVLLTDE